MFETTYTCWMWLWHISSPIIKAHEEWRPDCEGAVYPLQLLTDHQHPNNSLPKMLLNWRQAQCSEFLTRFEYRIVYRVGKSNRNVDALKQSPGDLPDRRDERLENMEQVVLKPQNLLEQLHLLADGQPFQNSPSLSERMTEAYGTDPLPRKILEAIRVGTSSTLLHIPQCIEQERRKWYRGKLYAPGNVALRLLLLQEHDETVPAGIQYKQIILTFSMDSVIGMKCERRLITM